MIEDSQKNSLDSLPEKLEELLEKESKRLESLESSDNTPAYLLSGFRDLDAITSGLPDSNLIVVGGATSDGEDFVRVEYCFERDLPTG